MNALYYIVRFFKGGGESCKWVGKEVKEVFFCGFLNFVLFSLFSCKTCVSRWCALSGDYQK